MALFYDDSVAKSTALHTTVCGELMVLLSYNGLVICQQHLARSSGHDNIFNSSILLVEHKIEGRMTVKLFSSLVLGRKKKCSWSLAMVTSFSGSGNAIHPLYIIYPTHREGEGIIMS